MNLTCNSTLEDLMISPGSEVIIVGPLNFHDLARIIAASCTLIAVVFSLYLVWMHAFNYTKPKEQRHIIRILFMVPVYALSSYFQLQWYWHAIYFQVISDCYEAFAIASFFALLCHYIGPDLHSQKDFFRLMNPIKPWVLPINWFAKCCGGRDKGPWRTPKSGLTWFNIIWIGIYHYCFIRVAMTITAVVTQYFNKYCESSNSPVFSHIWVIVLNAVAVTIAMYCVIQFYVQLKDALAEHKPFLKVLAIKLVIFLSFWQASAISIGTSTLHIVEPNSVLAYPDIKVGIPSLLLCFEMALFSILHLWAFPYAPYRPGAPTTFYPVPDRHKYAGMTPQENAHQAPSGGFLGLRAIGDALNIWDFVKAFGRGIRWLFCGVKRRKDDVSYKFGLDTFGGNKLDGAGYDPLNPGGKSTDHLPIAHEFRRSTFLMDGYGQSRVAGSSQARRQGDVVGEESAGLIDHAQPNPGAGPQADGSPPTGYPQQTAYEGARRHHPYQTPEEDIADATASGPYASPEAPPLHEHPAFRGAQYGQHQEQRVPYPESTYGDAAEPAYDPYAPVLPYGSPGTARSRTPQDYPSPAGRQRPGNDATQPWDNRI